MASPTGSPRGTSPTPEESGTLTPPPSPPKQTSDSLSSSPKPESPTTLTRTYKSATSLFLTRRLPDALALLTPLLPSATPGNPNCSPQLRVKIWSLYLAVLDAAAQATPDAGRQTWGTAKWRGIVKLVREGGVWDEVLRGGYEGARVDGEVLCALVMLNLSHAATQTGTQARIEEFLAQGGEAEGVEGLEVERGQRLRVLELYILHVLPRNGEWDYAREFTRFCAELGEEEKVSFLESLDQLEQAKQAEEAAAREAERIERENLEREKARQSKLTAALAARSKPTPPAPAKTSSTAATASTTPAIDSVIAPTPRTIGSSASSASTTPRPHHRPPHMISRLLSLTHALSTALRSAYGGTGLARLVLFMVAFIWAGSKQEVRARLRNLLGRGWASVARTVGMGVKVTYI